MYNILRTQPGEFLVKADSLHAVARSKKDDILSNIVRFVLFLALLVVVIHALKVQPEEREARKADVQKSVQAFLAGDWVPLSELPWHQQTWMGGSPDRRILQNYVMSGLITTNQAEAIWEAGPVECIARRRVLPSAEKEPTKP